ncbi:MAG: guanylate kinase [Desulfobulbaceae bacterium]|nr:guanylate kinase [Desulfobulbaceae bacterium]
MSNGLPFIISSPSGGGKTTILKKVFSELPGLVFSVSHTTRPPRTGEMNGRDYHFVDVEEFTVIRDQNPSGFLEWAKVHDNFYGTSRKEVEKLLGEGVDVVLDIDIQGARQIKEAIEAVSIFIAPPSLAELERRLRGRGTESEEVIALRLANAQREMAAAREYDYLVVNDSLSEAVETVRSIIIGERAKRRRGIAGIPFHADFF